MKYYNYLYYKLFKFWDAISVPKFLTDFKAGISLAILEVFLFFSLFQYYNVFIDRKADFDLFSPVALIVLLLILAGVYYPFIRKDRYKEIISKFDKLPKRKNEIGGVMVFLLIVLIVLSLILSFYFVSQVDWTRYH